MLPKASDPEAVRALAGALRAAGVPVTIAPIVTEDVEGVFAADATAAADELVGAVLWGAEDLSASLGAVRARDEAGDLLDVFRHVRSWVLLVASRRGKPCVDAPYLAVRDAEGLAREARAAARMGFAGKQAIHPAQIPVIHEAFMPTNEELESARRTVEAFKGGAAAAAAVDGAMADAPHLRSALALLARIEQPRS